MATVILQDQRTFFLKAFLDRFIGEERETLYLGIARQTTWANPNAPGIPQNSIDEKSNFLGDLIAAQLVPSNNIAPAIRRINWESGSSFDDFDSSSDASFSSNFYVLNSENRVYRVASKSPGSIASNEPLGNNSGNNISTGDGFVWEYLYTLDAALLPLLTNNFIPVPYRDAINAEQREFGDEEAYKTLGCNHILVISDVSDPVISDDISYRQIGLMTNLRYTNSDLITATAELGDNIDIADVLHIENRRAIIRAQGQSETFQTVLKIF